MYAWLLFEDTPVHCCFTCNNNIHMSVQPAWLKAGQFVFPTRPCCLPTWLISGPGRSPSHECHGKKAGWRKMWGQYPQASGKRG